MCIRDRQWLMLQQQEPEDFVIATGEQYSVRDFINVAAKELDMEIQWEGEGVEEKGYWINFKDTNNNEKIDSSPIIVAVDSHYFRPSEVETLLGDSSNAKNKLGWVPKISFEELVVDMVQTDLQIAKRDELVKGHGFQVMDYHE